ncbi:type IV secretory system conjugative DNA transfer family protein [Singulisphaera sp. PoT]|uniref:type IV secretory system conjugative DNA transfer family protein n=1 Tax=Singulisphaera sp. PoT TaxID=3411797 RepID=UPI003BF4C72E
MIEHPETLDLEQMPPELPGASFADALNRAGPWLHHLVPVLARLTLIGAGIALGLWLYGLPRYLLIVVVFGLAYRNRNRINLGTLWGSARWATAAELHEAGMLERTVGIVIGRLRDDRDNRKWEAIKRLVSRPLRESDGVVRHAISVFSNRLFDIYCGENGPLIFIPKNKYVHMLTVAPTGAGKNIGVVIPNLLFYIYSIVCIDIKGENYKATARHRKSVLGQNTLALNPFLVDGIPTETFNPFDLLNLGLPTFFEGCRSLADSLVVPKEGSRDPYWDNQARNLLTVIIVFVAVFGTEDERNMNTIKALLSDRDQLFGALQSMKASDEFGGLLGELAGSMLSVHEKEFASILSSVNNHTSFMSSPLIKASLSRTSFNIRSVVKDPTSLYLILPAEYLHSHANLMRLWINSLLLAVKQSGPSEEHELLFMLDEVAQLGQMEPLAEAVTLLRGYGVRMWFIVQSIAQLEECFPGPQSKTVLANFSTQIYFGLNDIESAQKLTQLIGQRTEAAPSLNRGWSTSSGGGGNSRSSSSGNSGGVTYSGLGRDLIRPDEILREKPDTMFVILQSRYPILGRRLSYFSDPEFAPSGSVTELPPISRTAFLVAALGVLAALYWAEAHIDLRALFSRTPSSALSNYPSQPRPTPEASWSTAPSPDLPLADIELLCPCGNRGIVPASLAGTTVTCQACNVLLSVPHPEEENAR